VGNYTYITFSNQKEKKEGKEVQSYFLSKDEEEEREYKIML
jgi:hypothetical protein